jgi:hypothetical protein
MTTKRKRSTKKVSKSDKLLAIEQKENKKTYHDKTLHIVVGVVFAFVSILHFIRFSYGFPVIIGSYNMSLWISLIGALGTGYLALWVWKGT